jgi:hypothetical protein
MRLAQNASQCSRSYFAMFGDRSSKRPLAGGFGKLYVAAGVTNFSESGSFELAFDSRGKERASCGFDFNFELPKLRRHRGYGRREMKLKRVAQIVDRFIFCPSLARYVDFDALSHEPFIFLPNTGGEFLFHFD